MKKTMIRTAALCAALLLPRLAAVGAQVSPDIVHVGSLAIHTSDLSLTPKDGYIYALFDAFPYRQSLKLDSSHPLRLEPIVKALVLKAVLASWPGTKLVKMDVVEFSQRDEYGARRWDTVTRLGKFSAKKSRHGWTVMRLSGPDLVR